MVNKNNNPKKKINPDIFFLIFFLMILIISATTSFFSIYSNNRTYIEFIKLTLLNSLFFVILIILFKRFNRYKIVKRAILFVFLLYLIFYLTSSVFFLKSGQSVKLQIISFAIVINPPYLTSIILLVLIFSIGIVSFILEERMAILGESEKRGFGFIQILIIVSMLFIIFTLLYPKLNLENEILRNYPHDKSFLIKENLNSEPKIISSNINTSKFNVIFILLESVSANKLSSYGYERNTTPNIDYIVNKGIKFENMYSISTHSDYAQPGYLSSNYVLNSDIRNFFLEQDNQNSVWDMFNREGYNTAYFSPQDDNWARMNKYFNYDSLNEYWYSETDGIYDYGWGNWKKDYDEKTIAKAIEYLEDKNSSENFPFFLYLNFQATHEPYEFPDENLNFLPDKSSIFSSIEEKNTAKTNRYDNALRYVDLQVGKLLGYLNETNLINNTIIVLSSDHGHDVLSERDKCGHGCSIYDRVTNVPFAILIPGEMPQIRRERVSHIDVLPTIADIMNFNSSEGFRGRPFERGKRIFFYAQNHMYLIGMIESDIKIILDMNRKLVEVYNLIEDPSEENNLVDEGDYSSQIRTLLTWHYCQLNYFSRKIPEEGLEEYCEVFRN